MSTTEIKQNLIKKIHSLSGRNLREVHGLVMNYVNSNSLSWDSLDELERIAIEKGSEQLDGGMGIPHEKVMAKIRKKFRK